MIKDILREIAPDSDPDTLADDADLRDSLELDSLDFLNFVEELAQRSGRRIDEDDYPKLATLASGAAFLAGS
jgi:acyl carrier protein